MLGEELDKVFNFQSDEHFMREALKLATRAFDAEEVPVGAVVVHQGRIVARAHNQTEQLKDATAHAEMIAITQASSALGDWRLAECTLYVTKEPCPMCAGAAVLSRIQRLVFGVGDEKMGAAGGALNIANDPRFNHRIEVVAGVLADQARALLKSFFEEQRKKPKG
ncbi:MAG: nucleoside deaminase [Verrucomicrobiae bacterium]|nr:nucleoside deaminase [Verrucomicrobiae bacterium]